jgi:hypothetical protein
LKKHCLSPDKPNERSRVAAASPLSTTGSPNKSRANAHRPGVKPARQPAPVDVIACRCSDRDSSRD